MSDLDWPLLEAEDEGELEYRIAADPLHDKLLIQFREPVAWLGLDRQAAMDLLMSLARQMARLLKSPVSVQFGDEISPRQRPTFGGGGLPESQHE